MRRTGIAIGAALVALSAFFGAAGLISGFLALEGDLDSRLPLASPVLGGVALALVVGVPFTWLSVLAWHGHRRTDTAAFVCGLGMIVWIAVELAFVRELSFLHVFFVAVGLAFAIAGRRGASGLRRFVRHPLQPGTS